MILRLAVYYGRRPHPQPLSFGATTRTHCKHDQKVVLQLKTTQKLTLTTARKQLGKASNLSRVGEKGWHTALSQMDLVRWAW